MNTNRRHAVAALIAAGLLWGTTVPLSKLALEWLAPGWLTAVRFGLAAAVLLAVARRRVQTAQHGYRLDLLRSKNLEGRPIEILNSFNLLHAARRDLIRALIGFNQAQFRLFVSLGQPPP